MRPWTTIVTLLSLVLAGCATSGPPINAFEEETVNRGWAAIRVLDAQLAGYDLRGDRTVALTQGAPDVSSPASRAAWTRHLDTAWHACFDHAHDPTCQGLAEVRRQWRALQAPADQAQALPSPRRT